MKYEEFKTSLVRDNPEPGIPIELKALWYDAKGKWERAHELIQDFSDTNSAWIHAYLHRKEGDTFNADYWYRKAGKTCPK